MEGKMETEHSYTEGSSSSSSGSSSGSSDGEEEALEPVNILGHVLELPQDLCEDYSIFKEVFSRSTWETLEDHQKEHLKKFLPKFHDNDEDEKEKTVQLLFNYEPFHFTSPLGDFYNNLKQGNYRPDIAKMRKFLMKARAKQQRHKIKSYYAKLLPEVLISRERVLAAAKAAPPGPIPRLPLLPAKSSKNNYKPLYLRAKQRYFEELASIRGEVGGEESEDENYPEGPPQQMFKKRKHMESGQPVESNAISGTLGNIDSNPTSLECLKNILAAHRARRQYRENHPELNTTGITVEDIQQRVALVNGTKKRMFGGKQEMPTPKLRRGPKKDPNKQKPDRGKKKEEQPMDINPLLPNIKIKCEQENSDSDGSLFVDPGNSPKQRKSLDHMEIKQEVDKYPGGKSLNYNDPDLDTVIKQEPLDPVVGASKMNQPIPIKLEDLDGIDMMALPIEIADESVDVLPNSSMETEDTVDVDESLTETTHANFLSLVRALFPARAAHRASKQELHARCSAVMKSPIAPLNTWYSLSNDWCAELDSALHFLAGERGPHPDEFVPYLQFMKNTQMYQWIGAGRDCDAILGRLCERWLRAVSPLPASNEPAPPRYPTSWVVRPPTSTELSEFRSQERRRFASASKPFTYTQHGYCSVVGPCTSSSSRMASILVQDRPRAVTLASLLRDAVARLPNGEGNIQHICVLLKMSQWIAPCSEQTLLTTVTSALDKLMSIKKDPVVSYDQRTTMWTYLHRHRSEEEWLKSVRNRSKASVTLPNTAPPAVPQSALPIRAPSVTDMDVSGVEEVVENASDSDVDVDDTNLPSNTQQLSSAQLLMQATQTTHKLPNKPKGKLVPTPQKPKPIKTPAKSNPNVKQNVEKPQKTKPTPPSKQSLPTPPKIPKQSQLPVQKSPTKTTIQKVVPKSAQAPKTVLVKQTSPSQKQANLMTQAAKQAQQLAQLTKPVTKNVVQKVVTKVQSPKQVVQKTLTPVKQQTPPSKPTPPLVKSATVPTIQPPKSVAVTTTKTVTSSAKIRAPVKSESLTSVPIAVVSSQQIVHTTTSTLTTPITHQTAKLPQGTRSLLIRPPAVHTTVTSVPASTLQTAATSRRGMVRVLSPATPSSGKSLISPQALLQQVTPTSKKRATLPNTKMVTTVAQPSTVPTVVSSVQNVTPTTRTVQLAGRTVQLANQTVHLPTGQAVQLAGHTLQLSSLQLPTHSVRLPSGQTVQLASSSIQTMRNQAKNQPKPQKNLQIPVSTVQLAGQTVQIGGQTVQLAGQSVQLTGHTVKLPSGQSVQVAGQSVQLPSGQTVQLASGNLQTVQLNQNMLSNQTVQIGGQLQLPSGQTLHLPGGQTLQLPSGQTLQLSGQTLQLASGQTVQLANQQIPKSMAQVIRSPAPSEKPAQPIVAKLLTNPQGQMISLDGMMGPRHIQMSNIRPRAGVRVISPGTRLSRPLLLTHKPLHNIILQQSDGSAIRVTSSGNVSASQTIVLSNIGAQSATTSTTVAPVLKLQQVNPIQQVKIAQGIKLQQGVTNATTVPTSAVRSVLMDGQQLKLVGGRHVLARLLRPAQSPQPPP